MADVVAIRQQLLEVSKVTAMYTDWEVAYNMQLEEAMAASVLDVDSPASDISRKEVSVREKNETGTVKSGSDVQSTANDLISVLEFQSVELLKLEQEIKDQHQAIEDAQGLLVEMRRRHHDMEFAKSVDEMSDEEWDRVGDYFEKPFHKIDEDDWDGDQICNLYTARAREEPGNVATAWSLTDAEGRVLIEQSKHLGMEVAAYVADYTALIDGLAVAVAAGVRNIHVCCNSLSVYNQVVGTWTARAPKQAKFLEQVLEHQRQLEKFSIELVPGHRNAHTIKLAHEAIRKHIEEGLRKGRQNQVASSSEQYISPPGEKQSVEECPICLEKVRETDTFKVKGCSHRFCVSCLTQHVQIRVKSNQVPVKCPQDCPNTVDINDCRVILSGELVESYAKSLAEASIPESDKVYCPFPNCSSLMSKSDLIPSSGASSSRQPRALVFGRTECMDCHRLFCAECRVPWHTDMSCETYQSLPPEGRDAEDIKLYRLASNNKWQRCKKCRRMIELDQGCYHMTCRCGHEFCYICGAPWVNKEATCKCKLWDEENIVGDPFSSDESETYSEVDSEFDEMQEILQTAYPFPTHPMNTNRPRAYKTRLCRYWMTGNCRAGVLCTFAHGSEDLRFMG